MNKSNTKTDRESKVQLIKDLISGKSQLKELNPVVFLEYKEIESEPGVYINKQGERLTEAQMYMEVTEAQKRASIVWHEIQTEC